MALIDLKDIYKIYQMGSTQINALDGLDCTIDKGGICSTYGPIWLRKVHTYECDRLLRLTKQWCLFAKRNQCKYNDG